MGFVKDSLVYYEVGGWISGHDVSAIPTFITPGYPLLLVVTGVTGLNTFAGLLLVQGAMAVTIPLLIYGSMRLIAPRVAFVTGLLAILLLVPFVWSKTVMSEQL